jgi:hypothetical protein
VSGWRLVDDRGLLRLDAPDMPPVLRGSLADWRRVRAVLRLALSGGCDEGYALECAIGCAFTRYGAALVVSLHCGDAVVFVEGPAAGALLDGVAAAISGVDAGVN